MGRYTVFLKWWLCFMLICLGTVVSYSFGIVDRVNEVDITNISFIIYAIFGIMTIYTGVNTWKVSNNPDPNSKFIKTHNHKSEIGWFMADNLLTLGMIGTVIGFIYMLSTSFAGLETVTSDNIQKLLTDMSLGFSTALYTTATGLVCSLLLKLQLFNLSYELENLSRKCVYEVDDNETS